MDRVKLAEVRKKKADNKTKAHKELLDSNASIKTAIEKLHDVINPAEKFDGKKILDQINSLKERLTFSEDIKRLEDSLSKLHKEPLKDFDKLIKSVGQINNKDVVKAVNALAKNIDSNTVSQKAEDYQPVRRVIKVGTRFIFDDTATPIAMGGGGGGRSASVQSALTRNDGTTIAVTNPDGSNISGGGGSGGLTDAELRASPVPVTGDLEVTVDPSGLATDDNQEEEIALLTEIEGNQLPDNHQVEVSNFPATQPVSATALPLPAGASTEAKQDDIITAINDIEVAPPVGGSTLAEQEAQTALLIDIEANQLPDGHNVTVDNQPTEFPLPSSQVTTLTPQTNALTDTELRATPVPISGTVTANTGLSQPLTDTQLRATPVPVDTGLTPQTDGLTDAELRASPVDVDTGLSQPTTPTDTQPVSGTFWQATQPVSNAGLTELASAINSDKVDVNIASGNITGFATSAKQDILLTELQLKADLTETQPVSLASVPTHGVTGTFWQATQPVSLTSVPSHAVTNAGVFAVQNTTSIPAGTNNIGDVDVLTLPSIPAGNNNIGDVDVASLPALPAGTNIIGSVLKARGATSTLSNVAGSATSVTLQASNTSRIKCVIVNDSTATLYVKEGSTASATSYTYRLNQYDTVIIDDYSGIVTGIWASATGNARVTETA